MQDPLIGTTFDERFRIISILGKGSTGVVYKATHQLMNQLVAIKILQPYVISDQETVKRFQQEAKAISSLSHPNIVGVHDFGVTGEGCTFLVMDFVDGVSLADVISKEGGLETKRAIDIFLQVVDTLTHAHAKAVLHRDLKPANFMLLTDQDGTERVKVVDFGMAKLLPEAGKEMDYLTQAGKLLGDPVYMSPEQCLGRTLDARSDIYSLGCVMYETLTGRPPYRGEHQLDTVHLHITSTPPSFNTARPDLNLPAPLEQAVRKALSKNPSDRYQSMGELAEALRTIRGSGSDSRPQSGTMPQANRRGTHWSLVYIKAVFLLILVGAISAIVWLSLSNSGQIAWWKLQLAREGNSGSAKEAALGHLADLFEKTNDYKSACSTVAKLARYIAKEPGDNSEQMLVLYERLARLYWRNNDAENARLSAHKARSVLSKSFFREQQECEKAELLYLQLIDVLKLVFDGKGEDLILSLQRLGQLYIFDGKLHLAEQYTREAIDLGETTIKQGESRYAATLVDLLVQLATIHGKLGKSNDVLPLYQRAVEIYKKYPTEVGSAEYFGILNGISFHYTVRREYDKAVPVLEQGIANLDKDSLQPTYPVALHVLSDCYLHLGNQKLAFKYGLESLQAWQKLGSKKLTYPEYGDQLRDLAHLYSDLGRQAEADRFYKKWEAAARGVDLQ